MKKYSVLLIDADQTLLDFSAAESLSIRATCEKFGIEFSEEVGRKYSEINLAEWKKHEKGLITREDIKRLRFEEFAAWVGYTGNPRELGLFYEGNLKNCGIILKGADALCQKLSQKYRLYLVTNGLLQVQKSRLALSGLLPYFSGCFISEAVGFSKPDKRFFDKVFEEIGCADKGEVCIIGDSLSSDIQGGVNAGIDTCLFGEADENCTPSPTYRARNFEELLNLF